MIDDITVLDTVHHDCYVEILRDLETPLHNSIDNMTITLKKGEVVSGRVYESARRALVFVTFNGIFDRVDPFLDPPFLVLDKYHLEDGSEQTACWRKLSPLEALSSEPKDWLR